jgi:hypothetical protein
VAEWQPAAPDLPEGAGVVVGRPEAERAVRGSRPDMGLSRLLRPSDHEVLAATKELLQESRRALRAGHLTLRVPASLGGGRLGWSAPAGLVRETVLRRLSELVRVDRLTQDDARIVVERFGLHGFPGGAGEARRLAGVKRQATTNAVNKVLRVLGSDIARQPILPVAVPSVGVARREEIVGSVLSTMGGPPEEHDLRRYVHARVRRDLLGDRVEPVPLRSASDRQRAHRARGQWLAVVSDHLDRGRLPDLSSLPVSASGAVEVDSWRQGLHDGEPILLSVEGLRALTKEGLGPAMPTDAAARRLLTGMLGDGYRTLLELTRYATWLLAPVGADPAIAPDRVQRAGLLLHLATVVALRGYPQLATAYIGSANTLIDRTPLDDVKPSALQRLRFASGMALESISYLRGPRHLVETRAWQQRLSEDLHQHEQPAPEEVTALAQAIVRAEHSAAQFGIASGATVVELLSPLHDLLDEGLAKSVPENRDRLLLVMSRLAEKINDKSLQERYRVPTKAASPPAATAPPAVRYDEWYVAWEVAMACWSPWSRPRGRDEWRR